MDKDMLKRMLKDLEKYKNNDKNSIMKNCINNRLSKSLQRYYESLMNSFNYLETKDALKILKNISKLD